MRTSLSSALLSQQWQMISVHCPAFGIIHNFQISLCRINWKIRKTAIYDLSHSCTYHSFKSNSIQIFGTVIPHDVGSGPRTGRWPILNIVDLASAAVSTVLVLPLPVDATHHSGAWEDSPNSDLFTLSSRFKQNSGIFITSLIISIAFTQLHGFKFKRQNDAKLKYYLSLPGVDIL